MNSRALRSLAAASLLAASVSHAAVRPRYGGVLHVQLLAPIARLDGDEAVRILPLIAETLMSADAKGVPVPQLADRWESDGRKIHWKFHVRPGVTMHDGSMLTPQTVVSSLNDSLRLALPEATFRGDTEYAYVDCGQPAPWLPSELANPRNSIVRRNGDQLAGTGPFRVTEFRNGNIGLAAFDQYWSGRPYLDAIELSASPSPRMPEVTEMPPQSSPRAMPEHLRPWQSAALELYALDVPEASAELSSAVAFSLDRAPIAGVLTQKRGEPAWTILPQWLSGYAFALSAKRDLDSAKRAAAGIRTAVVIASSDNDPLSRLIAERVVLNMREAGLNARSGSIAEAQIRVVRIRLFSTDAAYQLREIARQFGFNASVPPIASADDVLNAERKMLNERRLIPIVFVPELFATSTRVANWEESESRYSPVLHLENIWLQP